MQALLSQQVTQHFASVSRCSVVLGCLLDHLGPLFAPVSWCPKQNYPMCLAAAAVAAAVLARHSWVPSSARDEAPRVFHVEFFLLFEKSLCRCNLLAQSCKQLRHQRTCCGTVLFSASRGHRLGSSEFSPNGLRGVKKMVCLPSFSRPPAMSPDLRIEVTQLHPRWIRNSFHHVWNSDVTHQLRRYHVPTSVSLNTTNVQ